MAAPIIGHKFIEYKEFYIVVTLKVMRTVRYKLGATSGNTVELSAPHTLNDEELQDIVEKIYPKLLEMQKKKENSSAKIVMRPDEETYNKWYAQLESILSYTEKVMQIKARHYTLRYMRSRWGSYKPATDTITINIALASLPIECTEYLIVHEMAHILHRGHTREFWNCVELYYPDYRRVRAFLRSRIIE